MRLVKKWKRRTGFLTLTLAVSVAMTACTTSGGKKNTDVGKMDRDDEGALKVAYFNEQAFYMQYGNAFQAMFPNVSLEVVSTESLFSAEDPAAEMNKLLDEQQPDVLFLTEEQYAALAQGGKLYDLDAVVKQDEYDLDAFVPAVIDLVKARGGGKLYGLSPNFSSRALYYNKDLFDKHGVPYPTNGMSWEEVLQLASRFPVKKEGDDAFYGLQQPSQATDLFQLIRTIGEAKDLMYADAEAKTLSIDSPEWKDIFQSVIDGYKTGAVSMPSSGGDGGARGGISMRSVGGGNAISFGFDSMRFMSGQAAMTIDGPMLTNMMGISGGVSVSAATTSTKDDEGGTPELKSPFQDVNWDVVTIPVDPAQPDVASGMSLDNLFAINANSANLSAAWEFLKYANSEQLAKTNAKMSPSLSSRLAYKKEVEGKNMEAFYALGANMQAFMQTMPAGFEASFSQLASEHIKKVVDGTASLDEALAEIQKQGQDLLTKAVLDAGQE